MKRWQIPCLTPQVLTATTIKKNQWTNNDTLVKLLNININILMAPFKRNPEKMWYFDYDGKEGKVILLNDQIKISLTEGWCHDGCRQKLCQGGRVVYPFFFLVPET